MTRRTCFSRRRIARHAALRAARRSAGSALVLAAGLVLALTGGAGPAWSQQGQTLRLGKVDFRVLEGWRVSKSGSVRVANLRADRLSMLGRGIYLPAGRLLRLLDPPGPLPKDIEGNKWSPAITEDGLPLYVRIDGLHYRSASAFADIDTPLLAMIDDEVKIETRTYGALAPGPSSFYAARHADDGTLELLIDRRSFEPGFDGYQGPEWAPAPRSGVTLLETAALREPWPEPPRAIRLWNPADHVERLIEKAAKLDLDAGDVRALLDRRYVTSKLCRETIDLTQEIEGGLGAKIAPYFGSVDARLAVTGKYLKANSYPEGLAFDVARFERDDGFGGQLYYEVLSETLDCNDNDTNKRLMIAGGDAERGRLDTADAPQLKLSVNTDGKLIYRCRAEYMRIRNALAEQELTETALRLVIMELTAYRDARDADKCGAGG